VIEPARREKSFFDAESYQRAITLSVTELYYMISCLLDLKQSIFLQYSNESLKSMDFERELAPGKKSPTRVRFSGLEDRQAYDGDGDNDGGSSGRTRHRVQKVDELQASDLNDGTWLEGMNKLDQALWDVASASGMYACSCNVMCMYTNTHVT
jgi:hypothetical protein